MESVNANPVLIKEVNRGIIKRILMEKKKATKKELANATGLSVVTVNSILQKMQEEEEVLMSESIPSNGGRPSKVFVYNANFRYALLLYAHQGNTEDVIKVRVINLLSEVIYRKDYYVKEVEITTFEPFIEEAIKTYKTIGAIGFGLPGEEHNGIITMNDFPKLVGIDFLSHYREKYKVPIVMENDANAATMGYCSKQYLDKRGCVVGIYFLKKYPPGAGIVIDGKIYKGKNNFAGEIAKMPIGIDWMNRSYNIEEKKEQIAKLCAIMSCVLAPQRIVVHTDALLKEEQVSICEEYNSLIGESFQTEIIFSDNFPEEFEAGMKHITLELMENNLILTKEGK